MQLPSLRALVHLSALIAGVVVLLSAAASLPAKAEPPPAVCGECESYELARWYHDFSQCQQETTHNGDCGCGGSDCHLAIVDGKCKNGQPDCGHGNCAPETDDDEPVAALIESGGAPTCLSADQLARMADEGEIASLVELATAFPASVYLNHGRQALQVLNCAGSVWIHLPLEAPAFEALTTAAEANE